MIQLEQIASGYPSRERFLTELTLDPPDATSDQAGVPLLDEDYLILSTIHSAKGQEWKSVYLLNAVDGCMPSDLGVGTSAEIEEERRLLYVAMTRAKDDLHLIVPQRFFVHGQHAQGDRHLYASRTRFIPEKLLGLFERTAWPVAPPVSRHERPAKGPRSISAPACGECGGRRHRGTGVCNLYSITTNQAAIIALFRVVNRYVGNLAPMPGVFPDYKAPVVRKGAEGRELATARWGMPYSQQALMEATKKRAQKLEAKGKPVDFKELLRMEPDGGTTNIRNVKSKHWTRWLGVENRCVVPFNSLSEFNKAEGGDIWFALDESRPLACFAGIWTNWTSVRKIKEGETTNDLHAFLTTEPNAEVGAIHPKAMPVILTTPDEVETWMTAPPDEALKLLRPLPDASLRIVARGVKEDQAMLP